MNGPVILLLLVSIFVTSPSCFAGPTLNAGVVSTNAGSTWAYTLNNNESAGSGNYIRSFSVTLNAFVNFITSPSGWDFSSDFLTYVTWSGNDTPPYPFDVAPGASLAGFSVQSPGGVERMNSAVIESWNHPLDEPGPTSPLLSVSAPGSGAVTPAPEPGVWPASAALVVMLACSRRVLRP